MVIDWKASKITSGDVSAVSLMWLTYQNTWSLASIQTRSFINENGTGGESPNWTLKFEKSIVSFLILGGVPVFNRPIRSSSVSKLLANPIAGSSPILPAGRMSRPMLIWPRKNVPVVMITALAEICVPSLSKMPVVLTLVLASFDYWWTFMKQIFKLKWSTDQTVKPITVSLNSIIKNGHNSID